MSKQQQFAKQWRAFWFGMTVIGLLVFALGTMQANADAIDWSYTGEFSAALERCNARNTGEAYPLFGNQEKNCMLHNGFHQIIDNGQLIGWGDGYGNNYLSVEVLYVE